MNPALVKLWRGALCGGVIAAALLPAAAPAQVEVNFRLPSAFRATARPVYYGGHASYWYGDRWYYRDGDSWRSYRQEPDHLREYRGQHEQERRHYERGYERGYRR
jgi:hypothetical protein